MHSIRGRRGALRVVLAGLVLVGLSACAGHGLSPGLIGQMPQSEVTEAVLDAKTREFANRFSLRVEREGLEVYMTTRDPRARWAALRLVMRAQDEILRANAHADPVASVVDTWALCAQLLDWVRDGEGREAFGDQQERIVATFQELLDEFTVISDSMIGGPDEVPNLTQAVNDWVEAYPIEGREMARISTAPLLANLQPKRPRSLLATAESVEQAMTDLNHRMEAMQTYLPAQVILRLMTAMDIKLAELGVDGLVDRLDRAIAVLEVMPDLVDAQRALIMADVREERIAILEAVAAERVAILEAVREERIGAMQDIDGMRVATLAEVRGLWVAAADELDRQRNDSFGQLDGQRVQTLDEMDAWFVRFADYLSGERIETLQDVDAKLASTVDRAVDGMFWKMTLLLVEIFVGLVLLILLIRVLWGRPWPRAGAMTTSGDP